jgi:lysophospholipase L1-like esterase
VKASAQRLNFKEEILKKLIYPAIILSALTLAACGGGSGPGGGSGSGGGSGGDNQSGGQPSGSGSQKLASTVQVIDYYGDSTIWGWDGESGGQQARVQTPAPQVFDSALANPAHTVNHEGLGQNGQTACQLLRGPDGNPQDAPNPNPTQGKDWATLMQESNATVVILNHGINDFNGADTASRTTPDEYGNCLRELARIARDAQKFVIFETPNPISTPGLENYVQTMRNVASQLSIPVVDQHDYLTKLLAGNDAGTLMPDGLHPNQSTYRLKGEFAADEFEKIEK